MTVVEIIQSMLAPGIMISACGLLLLGMNNKYSQVINRIRILDDEKRRLLSKKRDQKLSEIEESRLSNIDLQLPKLAYRIKLVRNAVVFYSLAVGFFIVSCLFIGFNILNPMFNISNLAIISFLLGMLSVLTGVGYACREVIKGFQIVMIEMNSH
ncbi:MAG: DUF2721 domain-containing protein [Bacteroidales bacterium]|nr:DUF2721 domain-containing protein [Bacteroidales bacterium]